jgi:hypothetical protein
VVRCGGGLPTESGGAVSTDAIALAVTHGEVVGFAFLGALFLEALLLAFWIPGYYRRGIPVFREVVRRRAALSDDLVAALEARFAGGSLLPRLVFRRLSRHEIGFQEGAALFPLWTYLPMIRGLIRCEPNGRLVVVGILLWYPIAAAVAVVVGLGPSGISTMASALAAVLVVTFVMGVLQAARLRAVVESLAEYSALDSSR